MSRINALSIVIICLFIVTVPTSTNAASYILDDGTAEAFVGTTSDDLLWANQFNTILGSELITGISAAFGDFYNSANNLNGLPVTGSIWSDPNGDGSPSDAVKLAEVTGVISNYGYDNFNFFDIPDTLVTTSSFFVAFYFDNPSSGDQFFIARSDTDSLVTGVSWYSIGNGNDLTQALEHTLINGRPWLIRAEGISPVPEPSTLLLLGSGLVGLVGFGMKRFKN